MPLPASHAAAVTLLALSRSFGDFVAVDSLSFIVESGKIFGLLGSNGAGKTTLIKMLTTLLPPTSGDAFVSRWSIVLEPSEVRSHIGYVPQLLSADGNLTGRENLLFSARLYGIPRQEQAARITDALRLMDLSDAADRLVNTYSGGMIRRVELAQAMLHRPEVLFLDEPTIGLDPIARHTVWDCLRALRKDYGMTILLATHDMEEAAHLCDELALLKLGHLMARGTPKELCSSLSTTATLDDVFIHYCGRSIEQGDALTVNLNDVTRAGD